METEKQKMQGYVNLFRELQGAVGDENVAVLILEQLAKDARMSAILAQRSGNGENSRGDDLPATSKQIVYLKSMGVAVPAGLNKREASRMIDEAQNRAV